MVGRRRQECRHSTGSGPERLRNQRTEKEREREREREERERTHLLFERQVKVMNERLPPGTPSGASPSDYLIIISWRGGGKEDKRGEEEKERKKRREKGGVRYVRMFVCM